MKRLVLPALVVMVVLGGVGTIPGTGGLQGADAEGFEWRTRLEADCLPEPYEIVGTMRSTWIEMNEWNGSTISWARGKGTATGLETGRTWQVQYREAGVDAFDSEIGLDESAGLSRYFFRQPGARGARISVVQAGGSSGEQHCAFIYYDE